MKKKFGCYRVNIFMCEFCRISQGSLLTMRLKLMLLAMEINRVMNHPIVILTDK